VLLTAGNKLDPTEVSQKEKVPWIIDYLTAICDNLNPHNLKEATVHEFCSLKVSFRDLPD
jgi:hypothetical protein